MSGACCEHVQQRVLLGPSAEKAHAHLLPYKEPICAQNFVIPWLLIIFVCAQSGHGERRGRAPELIAPEYLQGAQCSTWSGVQRLALLFCSLCRQARFQRQESSI